MKRTARVADSTLHLWNINAALFVARADIECLVEEQPLSRGRVRIVTIGVVEELFRTRGHWIAGLS
ncbi:MAG TPA: hypothetical protein VH681_02865 [Nitrospiraceae bacterium]